MGMSAQTQNNAEITHVLEQLVELEKPFLDKVKNSDSVAEAFYNIDRSKLSANEKAIYDSIKSVMESNKVFEEISFISHSFLVDGFDKQQVAAAFFANRNGDVYFTARGTGEFRWLDNGMMMVEESSLMQRETCRYFEHIMNTVYKEGASINGQLVVAGHSKGGNDAQYITLFSKYRDLIDLCISFDGPGFSDAAKDKFEEECRKAGIDFDEYIKKIYGIVGENDFVFYRGRNLLMPEENIFVISTPAASDAMGCHMVNFLSMQVDKDGNPIPGLNLNWQRDENGNIINGSLGRLGELSLYLQKLEIEMKDIEAYRALALSVMTIVEKTLGGGYGAGDIDQADPETWQLFIKEGLPYLLNGLKERPDLILDVLTLFRVDTLGLDMEQAGVILNVLADIVSCADPLLLAKALEPAILTKHGEMVDLSKIDWGLLIKSLPPEQLAELLQKHLPALVKSLEDNQVLLNWLSGFISEKLGFTLPPRIVFAIAEVISDIISGLPSNALADLLEAGRDIIADLISGKGLDWGKILGLIQPVATLLLNSLKDRPGLILDILTLLGVDTFGMNEEQARIILNALADLVACADPLLLAKALESAIRTDGDNKIDLSKIDWGLLIKSLPPEQLAELLQKHLPALVKSLEDNPDLLNWLSGFISEKLGFTLPPRIVFAIAEGLSDIISWLPSNALTDLLEAGRDIIADLISGKGLDWGKVLGLLQPIATLLLSLGPDAAIALFKQLVKLAVDAIAALASALIDRIKDMIKTGIESIGNAVKDFADIASGVIGGAFNAISGIADTGAKFLKDTLDAFKEFIPPELKGAISVVERFISTINDAVKESAELCKNLLNFIKEGLKKLVDGVTSFASGAVDAIGNFIHGVVDKAADVTKDLVNVASDVRAKVQKAAAEVSSDVRKYLGQAVAKAFEGIKTMIGTIRDSVPWEYLQSWPEGFAAVAATWAFSAVNPGGAAVAGLITAVGAIKAMNNRVGFDITDLKMLHSHLQSVISGWNSWFGMIANVNATVIKVLSQSDKSYVLNAAAGARTLAASVDRDQKTVLDELRKLESGLAATITDYQNLEMSFT